MSIPVTKFRKHFLVCGCCNFNSWNFPSGNCPSGNCPIKSRAVEKIWSTIHKPLCSVIKFWFGTYVFVVVTDNHMTFTLDNVHLDNLLNCFSPFSHWCFKNTGVSDLLWMWVYGKWYKINQFPLFWTEVWNLFPTLLCRN